MRAMLRTGPVLLAAALLVLAPTISPGGPQVQNKGPFDIDPRTEEPNTPFDLSVRGGDPSDPEGSQPCFQLGLGSEGEAESTSARSDRGTDAVLLGDPIGTNVHVQVVDTEGNEAPPNTVLDSVDYTVDQAGTWGSPPLIPFPEGLAAGTYLVTAECEHLLLGSDGSQPEFVLLGNGGEAPQCTEQTLPDPPGNLGPGCYEAQELVIEAAEAGPADAEQEEPTFTG